VTGYRISKPEIDKDYPWCEGACKAHEQRLRKWKASKVIADVENIGKIKLVKGYYWIQTPAKLLYKELSLNQSCFIELTGEGKCKIISIK
jgi:hypothetical protein